MNVTTLSSRTHTSWIARLRAALAKAWAIHVQTSELIAESHRRFF